MDRDKYTTGQGKVTTSQGKFYYWTGISILLGRGKSYLHGWVLMEDGRGIYSRGETTGGGGMGRGQAPAMGLGEGAGGGVCPQPPGRQHRPRTKGQLFSFILKLKKKE